MIETRCGGIKNRMWTWPNLDMDLARLSDECANEHLVLREFMGFHFWLTYAWVVTGCAVGATRLPGVQSIPIYNLFCIGYGMLLVEGSSGWVTVVVRDVPSVPVNIMRQKSSPCIVRVISDISRSPFRHSSLVDWADVMRLSIVVPTQDLVNISLWKSQTIIKGDHTWTRGGCNSMTCFQR